METELNDLKEIAIAKIKVAYNRSIDIEATHTILWDKSNKSSKVNLIIALILSFIVPSLTLFTLNSINPQTFQNFVFVSNILVLILSIILIWEIIIKFTQDHGHTVLEALKLRDQCINFLENKLDNLDKKGYIEEIKSLEINDTKLKEKSKKYIDKISNKIELQINEKIEEMKKQSIRKHALLKEEIDSVNEKLKKFTALRTCETWIKFT